ncbi:membrane protein PM19L [Senna tora]|uniref:Membrane protein PM19L n=1 Tax=Senna tora TaxID=362788 RepID=A0A834W7W5_9FABA|nr:membrane protein PM19L [Senna tora]
MATVGRNIAAPLLFLNLLMYFIVLGFASWCLNRFINGTTNHPSFGGNGATMFFLIFAMLASVLGIVSKFLGSNHLRAWRNDSLAAAGASSVIAWAAGLQADKHRRAQRVETEAGLYSSRYGPGYRDTDHYGGAAADPMHKGTPAPVTGTRV